MGIQIHDTAMTAEVCGARAKITDAGRWEISWLPEGKTVDRNQAVTAMVLSEALAAKPEAGSQRWQFIDGWAKELGLDRNQALELFSQAKENQSSGTDTESLRGADPRFEGNHLALFGNNE